MPCTCFECTMCVCMFLYVCPNSGWWWCWNATLVLRNSSLFPIPANVFPARSFSHRHRHRHRCCAVCSVYVSVMATCWLPFSCDCNPGSQCVLYVKVRTCGFSIFPISFVSSCFFASLWRRSVVVIVDVAVVVVVVFAVVVAALCVEWLCAAQADIICTLSAHT